jgi:hypothetical protein
VDVGTVGRAGAAVLVGLVVFVILVPTSGAADMCFSLLPGLRVPCDGALAATAGVISAAIAGIGLWRMRRRPES